MDEIEKHTDDPLSLSKEDLETLFENAFNEEVSEGAKNTPKQPPKTPLFEGSFSAPHSGFSKSPSSESQVDKIKPMAEDSRSKSALRIKYEAEVEGIKESHGDLETIRRKLRLSKRKMAQLLLVDPSAWTRWTMKDGEAPPHVYRALQWYLLLQDKHPEYKSALWLNAVAQPQISEHELANIRKSLIDGSEDALKERARLILQSQNQDQQHLEGQLTRAQKQVSALNQRIQWLIIGQFALVFLMVVGVLISVS